jgi:predicted nucleotidyltransferase
LIDLSNKPELSLVAEIAVAMQKVAPNAFFIVGALARDLLLMHAHGVDTGRATRDVDIAVMVSDWAAFESIRSRLVESGTFVTTPSPHRLRYGGLAVDIVPFGGVEDVDGTITWPSTNAAMSAVGFQEALTTCETVRLPGGAEVQVASLPALAMLKLVAWSDRNPDRGTKDLQDFRTLARSYHRALGVDRLYSQNALLQRQDFDLESLSAYLLGQDAGRNHLSSIVAGTVGGRERPSLIGAVDRFLAGEKAADNFTTLVGSMGGSTTENSRLTLWFYDGLRDGMTPRTS